METIGFSGFVSGFFAAFAVYYGFISFHAQLFLAGFAYYVIGLFFFTLTVIRMYQSNPDAFNSNFFEQRIMNQDEQGVFDEIGYQVFTNLMTHIMSSTTCLMVQSILVFTTRQYNIVSIVS